MHILALSEHFLPRLGGTVAYVVEACRELARLGHQVSLIVPGPADPADHDEPYRIERLNVGATDCGELTRAQRYAFCNEAATRVEELVRNGEVDLIHVMFGLFLMETLDTSVLIGAPTVATVHNIPPMECRRSFNGDKLRRRIVDALRTVAVTAKNAQRLKAHLFDAYVVPSDQVRGSLRTRLPDARIVTIGHGAGTISQTVRAKPPVLDAATPVRLLTVGGYVPHKRQHLIPAVAAALRERGIAFTWDVTGPASRTVGYYDRVRAIAANHGLGEDILRLAPAVSDEDLAALYGRAHLYVQPSTEEGFCMTALDAAACGLPVIGCPAGALPDIAEASGGLLTQSTVSTLTDAIARFIAERRWPTTEGDRGAAVRERWSWPRQVGAHVALYQALLNVAADAPLPSLPRREDGVA